MKFVVSNEIKEWIANHVKECKTRAFDGGQFKYMFIPTSIVEVQTVKCLCCGEEYTYIVDF